MKKIKSIIIGLTSVFILLGFGIYVFMRGSLAPLDGVIKIQNLSHPVTVTRDAYGIPHIKAQNKLDALRALGFVMASERLFQMELSRRMVHGRLSEVFGDIALASDKLFRSLMLKRSGERMIAFKKSQGHYDEKIWEEMAAYFDGVNQYVNTRPLPYEMKILGIKPEPFLPMDAYMVTGYMGYSFGISLKAEPLMSKLISKLPLDQFQTLRNDPLKISKTLVKKNLQSSEPTFANLMMDLNFLGFFEGSNAWLIGPSRSQTGKSIFANDPHIGYSSPAVWFEAHIQTPEFELYGHYLPMVPFAILGHNRHHAWGFTMSLADDMDLYQETVNEKEKTTLFNNKPEPYQEWTEIIKIKNQPDLILKMKETRHGPIMDAVLNEKNLSLKWAYHKVENNPLKALREMAEAKDIKKFETALQYGTAPGLNVMYADADNIAWWILGDIAVKKNPNSDMILNGSTGDDEYERLLSWEEKPHLVNPASGIIVTANSRPVGLSEKIRGDWQSDDRYQTIYKALSDKDLWSAEEFKTLQTENYNAQTKNILESLLQNLQLTDEEQKKYEHLIGALKNWDSRSNIFSTEASVYHQWNNENILLMLKVFDDETRDSYLNTPYAWLFYERAILNKSSPWWTATGANNLSQVITEGFRKTVTALKQGHQWGDIHTVEYVHPLGKSFPLSLIFNLGPYPIPGAYNDINNNKMKALGGNFKVIAGPSTRRIIDFSEPQKSWGINPIGISGHMLSPFYKDQVQLFLHGKYRYQLMDEKDIAKAKTHELVLQ
ncbi:MAG: penicillin acylase family protein [Bdellovibrio sp.]